MNKNFIFIFLTVLVLFLAISTISANENVTDIVTFQDNSSQEISQNDINDYVLTNGTDEGDGGNSGDVQDNGTNDTDVEVNKSQTEISASDVVAYNNYNGKITVKLTSNGTALADRNVSIILNKVTYVRLTDSYGKAILDFKLKTGTYNVVFSFAGDENYTASNGTATVKVKDIVTYISLYSKKIDKFEGFYSIFKIKLLNVYKKPIKGKTIKIKVRGKTYYAKTDSKGIATFYIKLKKGSSTFYYSFSKSGGYLASKNSFKVQIKSLAKGNGYWVNKWSMPKVNLKKLSKLGTKHIFLLHTSFAKYGKTKVINWIKKAHKYGMKVHIWISVFYKDGHFIHASSKSGKFNYKHMNSIIKKVKYYAGFKEVDGIHFDYIRFGGNAYKYKNSVAAVNYFVKTACQSLRSVNPAIVISAALMPEPYDMKYYYAQDYSTMSKQLDIVVPMIYKGNYHASAKWIKKTTKTFVKKSKGALVWSGLQSYYSDAHVKKLPYKKLFKDAKAAKSGWAKGVVLFRWGLSPLINFKKLY